MEKTPGTGRRIRRPGTSAMTATRYELILALVQTIPAGFLASYAQIAGYLPAVGARQVGYALSGRRPLPPDLPWHRVVNARGAVSAHAGAAEQRRRLDAEGIVFDRQGRANWRRYRWPGPSHVWLLAHGLDPADSSIWDAAANKQV